MADKLTYLGGKSIGAVVPLTASAVAGLLAQLQPQLAGALNVQVGLTVGPPSAAITIEGCAAVLAALEFSGPVISVQVAAVADLIAALQAQIAALLEIQALLGTAGVEVYKYEGSNGGFAGAVAAGIPAGFNGAPPNEPANAVILGTVSPVTWSALQEVIGV